MSRLDWICFHNPIKTPLLKRGFYKRLTGRFALPNALKCNCSFVKLSIYRTTSGRNPENREVSDSVIDRLHAHMRSGRGGASWLIASSPKIFILA